jgi:hypothetical protein
VTVNATEPPIQLCARRNRDEIPTNITATLMRVKLDGSGTALTFVITVSADGLFVKTVPPTFRARVPAKPLTVSEVRTGIVPAASENMLNANALPDMDAPSGEFTAGP